MCQTSECFRHRRGDGSVFLSRYGAAYPHLGVPVPEKVIPNSNDLEPETKVLGAGHHGHVRPRDDGLKADCGGPGVCGNCDAEWFARYGADYPDDCPPPVGQMSDQDRRGAAMHMALRHREQIGKEYLTSHQRGNVSALIEDARAIDAFLQGKDKP